MKKLLALILALSLVLSLSACSDKIKETVNSINNSSKIESQVSKNETINDDLNTSESNGTSTEEPSKSEIEEEPKEEPVQEIEFSEITVIDDEACTIKITGLEPDSMWGYTIKVLLENKSTDLTYMFSIESASVNGVQVEPFWSADVAAGKKAKEEIRINDSFLKENNITEFTDIAITFRVYDFDDWMADDIAKESVHIYPYGESESQLFVRTALETDNVIVDNESTKVVIVGYEYDSIWGHSIKLYIENKTEKTLMYSTEETSINGFMISSLFAHSVAPSLNSFTEISLSNSELEENEIETIEEIEFNLKVYDYDNWMDDDIFNDVIVLEPKF